MAELPDIAKTEQVVVEKTNEFRKGQGRGVLVRNVALEHAASAYAVFLAKSGRFSHEADGRKIEARTSGSGYRHCTVAENLALNSDSRGFTSERLAELAVDGWKESSGHRKNMMLPGVTEIGVGVARAPGSEPKYVIVQLLGRPGHLAVEYRIVNRAQLAVTYRAGHSERVLQPGTVETATSCDEVKIEFVSAGNWPMVQKLARSFDVTGKTEFVLRQGSDARVLIEQK